MTDQNNNPVPENAPEVQPEAETMDYVVEAVEAQETEPVEGEAVAEAVTDEAIADEQPGTEGAGDAGEATEAPAEPWYHKITHSASAMAAATIGALVIVGLTAGLSAYTGTQAAEAERGHSKAALEQRAMPEGIDGADDADGTNGYDRGRGRDFDGFDRGYGKGYGNDYGYGCPDGSCGPDGYGYGFDKGNGADGFSQDNDTRGNRGDRSFDSQNDGTDDESTQNSRSDRSNGERPQLPENAEQPEGTA